MADLSYPVALVATVAVEVPLYAGLLPRLAPVSPRRAAVVGLAVNVVSHPLLWFVLVPLGRSISDRTLAPVAAAEIAVWLLEAAGAHRFAPAAWRTSLAVAAVANAITIGIGLLLWAA
jgi:hypothetical protein